MGRYNYKNLIVTLLLFVIELQFVAALSITVSPSTTVSDINLPSSQSLSIVFLPGNHNLESILTIENRADLSLTGTQGVTSITCSTMHRRSSNLRINRVASITIKNINFIGCNVQVTRSNNTDITLVTFHNNTYGALEFSTCFNVSIDQSEFKNNQDSAFGGVLELSTTSGFAVSRSSFTNNSVSSFAGVVGADNSTGYISCCNFYNNSARSFGGIIKSDRASLIYVTNSSFTRNQVSSFGGVILLDSDGDRVSVISSVFTYNNAGTFGGIINIDGIGSAVVVASAFSHNKPHMEAQSILDVVMARP